METEKNSKQIGGKRDFLLEVKAVTNVGKYLEIDGTHGFKPFR